MAFTPMINTLFLVIDPLTSFLDFILFLNIDLSLCFSSLLFQFLYFHELLRDLGILLLNLLVQFPNEPLFFIT